MPSNLLLLPLLAGYLFLRFAFQFRYRTQSLDGHKLVLWAACAGLGSGFVSRLIIVGGQRFAPGAFSQIQVFSSILPFEYAGTAVLSIVVALLAAALWNLRWELLVLKGFWKQFGSTPWLAMLYFTSQSGKRDYAINAAVGEQQNDLFKLINEAFSSKSLLSITLANRKFYVGYAKRRPTLSPEDQFVELVPILSGYRDKDTLEFHFTTDYQVDDAKPDPLSVMFPLKDIQVANRFDLERYMRSFADEEPTEVGEPVPMETDV